MITAATQGTAIPRRNDPVLLETAPVNNGSKAEPMPPMT